MNVEDTYNHIDERIAAYLSNDLPADERAELESWIVASPENKKYFDDRREVWLATGTIRKTDKFDSEAAYQRFLDRKAKATVVKLDVTIRKRSFSLRPVWYAAAMVVLLLATSYISYYKGGEKIMTRFTDITVEAPFGSRTKIYLPDGTLVWLNAGSKITYSQGFGVNERDVQMAGEGYFEVVRNEELQFIVNTQELKVSVLGTKFNFRNYPDDEEAIVSLLEGKVLATNRIRQSNQVILLPDQKVLLNKRTGEMRVSSKAEVKYTAEWTNGYLFFDEELLPDIVKELERSYDVKITLADRSLETFRFYGTFVRKEYRIEDILDMLASTGKIAYKVSGKEIELYAK